MIPFLCIITALYLNSFVYVFLACLCRCITKTPPVLTVGVLYSTVYTEGIISLKGALFLLLGRKEAGDQAADEAVAARVMVVLVVLVAVGMVRLLMAVMTVVVARAVMVVMMVAGAVVVMAAAVIVAGAVAVAEDFLDDLFEHRT